MRLRYEKPLDSSNSFYHRTAHGDSHASIASPDRSGIQPEPELRPVRPAAYPIPASAPVCPGIPDHPVALETHADPDAPANVRTIGDAYSLAHSYASTNHDARAHDDLHADTDAARDACTITILIKQHHQEPGNTSAVSEILEQII